MPQLNFTPAPIKGGHARHPRWFGPVRLTMSETTKDVWMTLLEHFDRIDGRGVVSLGMRLLADHSGHSVGAVRRAVDDLERRGLIVRLKDGPYRRRRWRMVLDEEPPNARTKPSTKRGTNWVNHRRGERGRFGPVTAPDQSATATQTHPVTGTRAHSLTGTQTHLATGSSAHLPAPATGSVAHDREDASHDALGADDEHALEMRDRYHDERVARLLAQLERREA